MPAVELKDNHAPGGIADDQPHAAPLYEPVSQLVYALKASDVRDVMVNGRVVVRDRQILTMDMKQVMAKAAEFQTKVRASLAPTSR